MKTPIQQLYEQMQARYLEAKAANESQTLIVGGDHKLFAIVGGKITQIDTTDMPGLNPQAETQPQPEPWKADPATLQDFNDFSPEPAPKKINFREFL